MSIETLDKLFGGTAKVKIIKLFLFNPEEIFDKAEILKRTRVSDANVRKELGLLENIKFIKKRSTFIEVKLKKTTKKKRIQGYALNPDFRYLSNLKNLFIDTEPVDSKEMARQIGRAGRIKLILVSGLFVHLDNSRVDLLIVGDDIKDRIIDNVVSQIEAEIGRELKYAVFSTPDFQYRINVADHLVRDIIEYPHKIVVDKIGL